MKLRKDQRYTAYIIMRESIIEGLPETGYSFCWMIKELFTEWDFYRNKWEESVKYFPELYAKGPKTISFAGVWILGETYEEERRTRLRMLKQCIEETEPLKPSIC